MSRLVSDSHHTLCLEHDPTARADVPAQRAYQAAQPHAASHPHDGQAEAQLMLDEAEHTLLRLSRFGIFRTIRE